MKRFRWLFIALLIALPLGLGGLLRERSSWRPRTLWEGRAPVENVIFSHDGNWLAASIGEERGPTRLLAPRLYVWNAHSLALRHDIPVDLRLIDMDQFFIKELWLSPDNRMLAARIADIYYGRRSKIVLWDMNTGRKLYVLDNIESMVFSSDSRYLTGVKGSFGGSWRRPEPDVVVYHARSGKVARAFNLHPPRKRFFYGYDPSASGSGSGVGYSLSPDGHWVAVHLKKASARPDHHITEWSGTLLVDTTGQQATRFLSQNERLNVFSRDGRTMLVTVPFDSQGTSDAKSTRRVRNTQTGKLLWKWKLPANSYVSDFSPDNSLLLTNEGEFHILREVTTGRLYAKLQGGAEAYHWHFSPDGSWIGNAGFDSYDTRALIWDAKTGQLARRLKAHRRPLNDIAFSPDGSTVATASLDGSLKLWRLR